MRDYACIMCVFVQDVYMDSVPVHRGRNHMRCVHLRQMKALMFDSSIQQENRESHVRVRLTSTNGLSLHTHILNIMLLSFHELTELCTVHSFQVKLL